MVSYQSEDLSIDDEEYDLNYICSCKGNNSLGETRTGILECSSIVENINLKLPLLIKHVLCRQITPISIYIVRCILYSFNNWVSGSELACCGIKISFTSCR